MEPRISVITLGVADLARSRPFFEHGLGWQASSRSNERIAFFQGGGLVLALYSRRALAEEAHLGNDGTGFGGMTLAYNARQREDVETVLGDF
jgi:catechol 2,3-dioxygenase-like lactoylglutathione lyase family enzyme